MLTREEAIKILQDGVCNHCMDLESIQNYCDDCTDEIALILKQKSEQSTTTSFTKEKALQSLNALITMDDSDSVTVNKIFLKEIIDAATKSPEQPMRKVINTTQIRIRNYECLLFSYDDGSHWIYGVESRRWEKLSPIPQCTEEITNA